MSIQNPIAAAMLRMRQSGLLPMLLQHLQKQQGGTQPPPAAGGGTQPQQTPPQTQQAQPPAGGGGGGGGVTYNTAGAGATMPAPVPQPHEAFKGLFSLLSGMKERKQKKQDAEAANIAQNLMDALSKKDVARVYEIMNDKDSTKVLDKVYKGWLEKVKDINTPDKSSPEVQAFEKGIVNYLNNKGQQPDMPKVIGGRMVPQATPQANLGAAQTNAAVQSAQQQPSLLTGGLTPAEQVTRGRVAAGMQPPPYVSPEIQLKITQAYTGVKKAELEAQKAQLEVQKMQAEAQGAEAKGAAASKIADKQLLKAQVQLDIEKQKLHNLMAGVGKPKGKTVPISDRLKWEAISKAESLLDGIQAQKRGFSGSDIQALTQELTAAGAGNLAKALPGWWSRTFVGGNKDVTDILDSLRSYKESFKKALDDGYPNWDGKGAASAGGETEDDTPDEVIDEDNDLVVKPEDMVPKKPD